MITPIWKSKMNNKRLIWNHKVETAQLKVLQLTTGKKSHTVSGTKMKKANHIIPILPNSITSPHFYKFLDFATYI